MDRESRIFIAGHRGLVGSAIARRLRQEGYMNLLLKTRAELDLTDQRAVAGFFAAERPDYVFLAAAKVGGIGANSTLGAEFIYHNLMIQTNVLHQSWVNGVRRLLFLGSSCIYPKLAPQPIREEHLLTGPLEPTNSPYAMAKIAGIEMCRAYNAQYGASFIPVMPTNLYGPGDNFDLVGSHVLPAMLRKFHLAKLASRGDWQAVAKDEARFGPLSDEVTQAIGRFSDPRVEPKVVLWGTGTPRREFLHVDDLARACVHLMRDHQGVELLNIGTGVDLTITELAGLVADVVGFAGETEFDAAKPDGTPRKLLDVSRLKATGFEPSIPLKQGIQQTYDWYLAQTRA